MRRGTDGQGEDVEEQDAPHDGEGSDGSDAIGEDEEGQQDEESDGEGQDGEAAAGEPAEAQEQQLAERREANIRAMLTNSLQVQRQAVMSKYLTLQESEKTLKRPFISPKPGAPAMSEALRRKLAARKLFVAWGQTKPFLVPSLARPLRPPELEELPVPTLPAPQPPPADDVLPEGVEPLVLWAPPEGVDGGPICVDNMLVRFLRPHQREGVAFMFDCVTGQRLDGCYGCILADDMGLGKTLQGITLLWSLLQSGHELVGGSPIAQRVIIVCPTSLVSNWDSECSKWLKGRLSTVALCEASRDDVLSGIATFLAPRHHPKVLIVSYETFRLHAARLQVPGACDLLICDEAHRLKNDATLTNQALDALPCRRRVLLSGTPMQNHLEEFFAMVSFTNPGVLGTPAQFRREYESPILAGREPGASAEVVALGEERSGRLSALVNGFILRRTNALLSQHLPPKVVQVVCCKLTVLQQVLYQHFLESKATRKLLLAASGQGQGHGTAGVLSAITSLKKLCNHPKLIYDAVYSNAAVDKAPSGAKGKAGAGQDALAAGFKNVGDLFPPGLFDNGRVGRGGMALGWELLGGKMAVLARMLHLLHTETQDRIVIVSNYTQTLDLVAQLCRERGYPFLRLDGSTSINKRQKLVKAFNDPLDRQFVFLLSSKAGGCGLNLIGGNRLVLFDPDWNPANDKQAAGRVWRDGQKKHVYVYRFLSSGTIEEKVFQRQLSKEGLQSLVGKNGKATAAMMSANELKELFRLQADTMSNTYEMMCLYKGQAAGAGDREGGPEGRGGEAAKRGKGGKRGAGRGGAAKRRGEEEDEAEEEEEEQEEQDVVQVLDADNEASEAAAVGAAVGAAAEVATSGDHGMAAEPDAASGQPSEATAAMLPVFKVQDGNPSEEDLQRWGHHSSASTVPDAVMQRSAGDDVSFVFTCEVDGKAPELPCGPGSGGASGSGGQHLGGGGAGLRGAAGRLGAGRRGATVAMTAGPGPASSGASTSLGKENTLPRQQPPADPGPGARLGGPGLSAALVPSKRSQQSLVHGATEATAGAVKHMEQAPQGGREPGDALRTSAASGSHDGSGAVGGLGAVKRPRLGAPLARPVAVGVAAAARPAAAVRSHEVVVLDGSSDDDGGGSSSDFQD